MMTNLILDGNNLVNAAFYVLVKDGQATESKLIEIQSLFKKMISNLGNQFNTTNIFLAWDGPRGSSRRKELLTEYKANRGERNPYLTQALALCKENNYKQFCIPYSEGDDTINALVQILDGDNIIVSSDKDFIQCVQRGYASKLYNFINKSFREIPEHDIILEKAIVGDTSDNIKGIHGIGPKKFLKLLENNFKELTQEQQDIIDKNCIIIDLNKNPKIDYIWKSIIDILAK
ncbi:MAG: hypothetical protein HGA35_02075 [Erysipelotrichaceae bacterium]|nr:hypothetical protein [Erysipelotrichaceae bacterium]